MTLKEKRLVVVALPLISEGEISLVQGVKQELERRGGNEVMVLSGGYEAPLRRLASSGLLAGVIGEFMGGAWIRSLLTEGVRVVALGADVVPDLVTVGSDEAAIGGESARALLSEGMASIAYLGPSGAPGAVRLGEAFVAACRAAGHEVRHRDLCSSLLLGEFLTSLPRPAGLLCASDHLARQAIRAAGDKGLSIPRDLAVIGVGNDRMESLHAGLEISSFEIPHMEMGKLAAAAMISLMDGGTPRSVLVKARFHERESSLRTGSGLSRAMAWLKSHPGAPVTAGELARIAAMSRRSFETEVKDAMGCSPGQLIREERRRHAEELLRETETPVSEIAARCGYAEVAAFSSAFRRWSGCSPRGFRHRAAADGHCRRQ